MKMQSLMLAAATALAPTLASAWTLETDTSTVSFGSIKNDYVGEAHSFSGISGSVSEDGMFSLDINLASVATNIDIRNERMIAHVFGDTVTATVTATVDMATMEAMAVGDSAVMEMDATIGLLGAETPFFLNMFVMRLDENRVMAVSNAPVYLPTSDLGVDGGVDTLQELAGLDSITRVTPITARLIFSR